LFLPKVSKEKERSLTEPPVGGSYPYYKKSPLPALFSSKKGKPPVFKKTKIFWRDGLRLGRSNFVILMFKKTKFF
jgi:hypothetical protein